MDYRRDIDGMRTIAVGAVVIDHALPWALPGGFVGVDIFFVLSGFLITSILAKELSEGRFSLITFYERRARRILPALFALLVVWGAIGWFLFPPDIYHAFAKSGVTTLLFSSNIWFWHATGDYFAVGSKFEPLLHTWSLGVEEQYYLIVPLLLWVLWRRPRFVVAAIWALVIASFLLAVYQVNGPASTNRSTIFAFFWLPTRAWELGLGGLLALGAFGAPRDNRTATIVAVLGLAAIVLPMALLSDKSAFPGLNALPVCAGTVALLWAGGTSGRNTFISRALGIRPMVAIGLISYSLYLWHWPPLILARVWTSSLELSVPLALLCIAGALVAAWASWAFIERPFRIRGLIPRGAIFGLSGAAGVALLAAGVMIHRQAGFPSRLPPEIGRIYASASQGREVGEHCQDLIREGKECWLGAKAEGKIANLLLWGDSHSIALAPGFDAWLREQGLKARAVTLGGCPPLPGVIRPGNASEVATCTQSNNETLAWLDAAPPMTVVLVSRWRVQRSGEFTPGESAAPFDLHAANSALADLDQTALFDHEFTALIRRLEAHGHQVVVIESIPEMGIDIPRALVMAGLRHVPLGSPLSTEEHKRRIAETKTFFETATAGSSVILRDPAAFLCDQDCTVQRDGLLYYYDDDHLSPGAAKRLVPWLMAPLAGLIHPQSDS